MDVPYIIHHIKLNRNFLVFPKFNFQSEGNLCVFWWEEIALGHCYIEPGKSKTYEELLILMVDSVKNTLRFYGNNESKTFSWEELKENEKEWYESVKRTFTELDSGETPDSVQISVIICTRNRPHHLGRCLAMMDSLTCKPREILVIDNASDSKETYEVVNKFKEVTY